MRICSRRTAISRPFFSPPSVRTEKCEELTRIQCGSASLEDAKHKEAHPNKSRGTTTRRRQNTREIRNEVFNAMKCYHVLTSTMVLAPARFFLEKEDSRLDSWRPLRAPPPLNYGEAITEHTQRRIPDASLLPKLELEKGELVACPRSVKVSAAPSAHAQRR